MANYGPLAAEIVSGVCGILANFNGFRVLPSLLQRRRSREANQTLHAVYNSSLLAGTLYTLSGALALDGILCGAKFTLYPSLAFSYVAALGLLHVRHSNSRRQPNFATPYREWNYGTFAEVATYIRLGGYHVGHRPTL